MTVTRCTGYFATCMLSTMLHAKRSTPVKLFRSLWGLQSQSHEKSWADLFANIRSQGFDGVEASLADIGWYRDRGQAFRRHLQDSQLQYILGLYSDWDDYQGSPQARHTSEQHSAQLQDQLRSAVALTSPAPFHINVHGGSDRLPAATAAEFFRNASAFISEIGIPSTGVSFETHRGRCLYSPWPTALYLQQFPNLKLTLDLSHWVLVTESLLDSKQDRKWLEDEVAPRVCHVHARIGTPQQSQLPLLSVSSHKDTHEAQYYQDCHVRFEEIWKLCRRKGCETFTVEYGPPPYAPFTTSDESLSTMIKAEAHRLRGVLEHIA